MKILPITLLLTAAVSFAAETPPKAPALVPESAPKATPPSPPAALTPSRFIAGDVDAHILKLKQRLAINSREQGPFGLYQVPGKTPIIATTLRRKPVEQTPFIDYINRIQISVINAAEKEFLVGARLFRLGQVFPIESGGERLTVRVESIHPTQINFKNLDSGEVAARKLDVLPPGITASNSGTIQVQGVTPKSSGDAAPLQLDFDVSSPRP